MALPQVRHQAPTTGDDGQDHYIIRGLLGEGGFGQVYEAWDEQLCRPVALKRLRCTGPSTPATDTLLAEARRTASLRHDAFVRVFAIAGHGAERAIVMELVQGRTLREVLRQAPPDRSLALDIVAQVADAMAEAHAAGLVHGDLKPSNLMLAPDGKVRILDLGLACHADPLATQSLPLEVQGTVAYLAPERLLGHPLRCACDIYSLGILLHEMLAGQRPLGHLDGIALAAARLQSAGAGDLPPDLPPRLAALVEAMTARDPARRTPSMRAVSSAIASLQGPLPEPATLPRHRRRRPWRWCALLLLALGMPAPERDPMPAALSEPAVLREGMASLMLLDRRAEQDKAIARFSEVLERNPASATAAAGMALANSLRYIDNGRDEVLLQQADASAQLALALDDQLALAHAARAWVAEFQGRKQEALAAADLALHLDPYHLPALFGKARLLIHDQQFDAADRLLDKAMAHYPRQHLFQSLRGTLRFRQGDYHGAEAAFRYCIKLDPLASNAYASLSQALLRQGRGDESLAVLQQGLQLSPDWTLYTNLGDALFSRADYLGAVRAFERAVVPPAGNPHNYLLWANLGDAQRWVPTHARLAQRSYRHAVSLLAPLLARSPGNPTFLSRMAVYQARLGETDAALAGARQAAALAPDSPDVQFRAALAREIGGERDHALVALERALTLGYPIGMVDNDPDLLDLRRDPRYLQLHLKE